MRSVAVVFALVLINIASDRVFMDAQNLSVTVLHLEEMYNNLTATYDSKLSVLENRLNTVLVTTNSALMNIEKKLETANIELSSVKSDLQIKTEQLTNVTRVLTNIQSAVCFEVTADSSASNSLAGHAVINFSHVTLNKGNGYDRASGIFTSSVPGNYLFWVHIFNHDRLQHLAISMRKNNVDVVRAFTPDNLYGGVASATALIHLDKGEKVSFYNGGSVAIYGHTMSSYGGALLSAD